MKITCQIASAWKKVTVRPWRSCKIGEDSMAQGSDVSSDLTLNPASEYCSKLEDGMYSMQWTTFRRPEVAGLLKFVWEGRKTCLPDKTVLDKELPIRKPDFTDLHSEKFKSGVWVAWLGHACVLVQIEGVRILTDPVFSKTLGPTMMVSIGPTRYRDAPCRVANLPKIHVVVISHNHYDHLDVQTVRDLNQHQPDIIWLVPMGVAEWMKSTGCHNVFELNWWQKRTVSNLSFYFVPAQHWSKRGAMDTNKTYEVPLPVQPNQSRSQCSEPVREVLNEQIETGMPQISFSTRYSWKVFPLQRVNGGLGIVQAKIEVLEGCDSLMGIEGVQIIKTLWGGWCVLGKSRKFYFAGDTGYHDGLFKEIGRLLGPFDLAAIPIGAYEPKWFLKFQHINPEDAFKIHKDVQAKKSIGIHWATFNLSSEPYLEPRDKIHELQQQQHDGGEEDDFFTVDLGEARFLDD